MKTLSVNIPMKIQPYIVAWYLFSEVVDDKFLNINISDCEMVKYDISIDEAIDFGKKIIDCKIKVVNKELKLSKILYVVDEEIKNYLFIDKGKIYGIVKKD